MTSPTFSSRVMQRSGQKRLQISHDSHSLKFRQRRDSLIASSLLKPSSTGENLLLRFFRERLLRFGLLRTFFLHSLIIIPHSAIRIPKWRSGEVSSDCFCPLLACGNGIDGPSRSGHHVPACKDTFHTGLTGIRIHSHRSVRIDIQSL
jgi:hypothetical protein